MTKELNRWALKLVAATAHLDPHRTFPAGAWPLSGCWASEIRAKLDHQAAGPCTSPPISMAPRLLEVRPELSPLVNFLKERKASSCTPSTGRSRPPAVSSQGLGYLLLTCSLPRVRATFLFRLARAIATTKRRLHGASVGPRSRVCHSQGCLSATLFSRLSYRRVGNNRRPHFVFHKDCASPTFVL
jgi:hypothetical protein